MPKKQHAAKTLTFMHSNPDLNSAYTNNTKTVATTDTMTYVLTSAATDPRDIPELEGLLPSSAYTLQIVLKENTEPLLLVGEQHPDKSLKKHHVWDFFGGKTHPEENALEAALRERIEETGLTNTTAPYLDPVIYVVFDDHGERCAKAFFFSVLNYELLNKSNFLPQCKYEINKIADGRFEIIALATVKIYDFFEQISHKSDKTHDAYLDSRRLILQDHLHDGLHSRNTWRKHVPLLLGNTVVQGMIAQVVQNFAPPVKVSGKAALRA